MHAPRWFWFAGGLLAVNALLVTTTSVRKHVWAQTNTSGLPEVSNEKQATDDDLPSQGSPTSVAEAPVLSDSTSTTSLPPLPSGSDESLPEIPSLRDAESLANDPVFSEIKKMFSSEEVLEDSAPPTISGPVTSADYYHRLDQRLNTASKLCQSARNLAAEAATLSDYGDKSGAHELLNMANQLREMAATLLVREL